jgi:hypothetical protein
MLAVTRSSSPLHIDRRPVDPDPRDFLVRPLPEVSGQTLSAARISPTRQSLDVAPALPNGLKAPPRALGQPLGWGEAVDFNRRFLKILLQDQPLGSGPAQRLRNQDNSLRKISALRAAGQIPQARVEIARLVKPPTAAQGLQWPKLSEAWDRFRDEVVRSYPPGSAQVAEIEELTSAVREITSHYSNAQHEIGSDY